MLYRILLYAIGLFIASSGLSITLVYLSYSNMGFTLIESINILLKSPSTYLFALGTILSLSTLFYDLLKAKK